MSRVRTGHGPDDWKPEAPATPHHFSRNYAVVPAEVIGSMRPTMTVGGLPSTWRTGYKQQALRVVEKRR